MELTRELEQVQSRVRSGEFAVVSLATAIAVHISHCHVTVYDPNNSVLLPQ